MVSPFKFLQKQQLFPILQNKVSAKLKEYSVILTTYFYGMNQKITKSVDSNFTFQSYERF